MLALVLLAALIASEAAIPPPPTRWVEDPGGMLSPTTRAAVDGRLEAYQGATGHQVVVWIGDTLGGGALDDWAVRTFAAWKVGREGQDDGVAMFLFAADRTIDVEVGYGLEGVVPDAVASRIIAGMTERLKVGDADGAVTAGVEALLTAIEGRPWTGAGPATGGRAPPRSWVQWLLGALAIAGFLVLMITHPRLALMLLWTVAAGGRRGGDGGGGGFSGGGGSSCGGGARGHW